MLPNNDCRSKLLPKCILGYFVPNYIILPIFIGANADVSKQWLFELYQTWMYCKLLPNCISDSICCEIRKQLQIILDTQELYWGNHWYEAFPYGKFVTIYSVMNTTRPTQYFDGIKWSSPIHTSCCWHIYVERNKNSFLFPWKEK